MRTAWASSLKPLGACLLAVMLCAGLAQPAHAITANTSVIPSAVTVTKETAYRGVFEGGAEAHTGLFCHGNPVNMSDPTGKWGDGNARSGTTGLGSRGHSDFPGQGVFDYTEEDRVHNPMNPAYMWRHFRPLRESEPEIIVAIANCDPVDFQQKAHQMQDFFSHYGQGFRSIQNMWGNGAAYIFQGHGISSVLNDKLGLGRVAGTARPDNALDYKDAYDAATTRTQYWWDRWNRCCKQNWDFSWSLKPGVSQAEINAPPPPYAMGDKAPPPTPAPGYMRQGWNATVGGISGLGSMIGDVFAF